MAITWIDGFDLYSATVGLSARYTGISGTPSLVTGRFGGQAVNTSTTTAFSVPFTATSTLAIGMAINANSSAFRTTGEAFMRLRNAGTIICEIGLDVNGAIKFGRTDFTTNNIVSSANGTILSATWYYVEIEFTRNGSTGAVNIYVNSVLVATASGVNTGASNIDNLLFQQDVGGAVSIDDLYVANVATKLGERRVEVLRPSADTAQKDWTPNSGANNFDRVNETTYNGDTSYVSSATAGNKDRYAFGNLSATPVSISAVQVTFAHRKDDATTRTIRSNLKSGATTANGATIGTNATYAVQVDIYETDPNTAAAWTGANVDSAEAGLEVVS